MGDEWVKAVSLGHRWLEKSHAARVKADTKMESKDEDRNGLGIGEPMQGNSTGPKKKDAEAQKGLQDIRACPKSRKQGGRKKGLGSTRCHVTTREGALSPLACVAEAALLSWAPHAGLCVLSRPWFIHRVVICRSQ